MQVSEQFIQRFALGEASLDECLRVMPHVFDNQEFKNRVSEVLQSVTDEMQRGRLEATHQELYEVGRKFRNVWQ